MSDKEGGSSSSNNNVCKDIQRCLLDCGLQDIGFKGSPFTWHRQGLSERLDGAVINKSCCVRFDDASIFHLPKFKIDHVPLWLCFSHNVESNNGQCPFRFLASWLTHDGFSEVVRNNWRVCDDWNLNLTSLTYVVKRWNKDVFGNITLRKHCLLNHLHGIARSLSNGDNSYLYHLLNKLWFEYDQLLYQKEVFWFQKSRCKLLESGDKNTRYFHGTTVSIRKKQKIESLQDSNGIWVTDQDVLRGMAQSFFQELYIDEGPDTSSGIFGCFPSLPAEDRNRLHDPISYLEVKNALF